MGGEAFGTRLGGGLFTTLSDTLASFLSFFLSFSLHLSHPCPPFSAATPLPGCRLSRRLCGACERREGCRQIGWAHALSFSLSIATALAHVSLALHIAPVPPRPAPSSVPPPLRVSALRERVRTSWRGDQRREKRREALDRPPPPLPSGRRGRAQNLCLTFPPSLSPHHSHDPRRPQPQLCQAPGRVPLPRDRAQAPRARGGPPRRQNNLPGDWRHDRTHPADHRRGDGGRGGRAGHAGWVLWVRVKER